MIQSKPIAFSFCLIAALLIEGSAYGDAKVNKPVILSVTVPHEINAVESPASEFAFNLFKHAVCMSPSENHFLSPASVAQALAMTCNGASGETLVVMAKVLGIDPKKLAEGNASFSHFRKRFENSGRDVQVTMANALFGNKGIEFREDFLKNCVDFYDGKLSALDFNDPNAAAVINSWVRDRTHGKIQSIVDDKIDSLTILFLLNAIYFKGQWVDRFDPANTKEQDFFLANGGKQKCKMMSQSGTFDYYTCPSFQAISLPYKYNLSMDIFLPSPETNLSSFIEQINGNSWADWTKSMISSPGRISLPKFHIEDSLILNQPLCDLGMGVAFDKNSADFRNMVSPGSFALLQPYIGEVLHKTYVDVNEEGTEAAAATKVTMEAGSMIRKREQPPFEMVVNRPFFLDIRECITNEILFIGQVTAPQA